LKFSKRRRAVPLRPIWSIMVAAKLDHSRVLVFRQNQLTLKGRSAGRSAGQRHTDTQIEANFKMYLLSVLFESSRFFYSAQETQTQKRMDQNFEIRIL